jgi:hypothetical protein
VSAEVTNALEQRAHQLDAEAETADTEARAHPTLLKFVAQEFRTLALMIQGKDPAREAADQLARNASTSGLAVERTDEAGAPVPAPPDAAMPQSGAQP